MARTTIIVLTGALVWMARIPATAQQGGAGTLQLTEVRATPLPDSGTVSGVVAAPWGVALVAYAGRSALSLVQAGRPAEQVVSLRLRKPVGIALISGDSLVEAVDTAGSRVRRVRLGRDGRVVEEQRYRLTVTPSDAVWTEEGWYLGGADTAGTYHVFQVDRSGRAEELGAVTRGAVPIAVPVHLTVCNGEVVLTQRITPFRVTRLSRGHPVRDLAPYVPVDTTTGQNAPLWRSAPTVCLDGRYLRTFSDLRSDRRVLVIYGNDGQVIRTREIDAPFALVGNVAGDGGLLAIRRAGAPELVWYNWRWSGTNP